MGPLPLRQGLPESMDVRDILLGAPLVAALPSRGPLRLHVSPRLPIQGLDQLMLLLLILQYVLELDLPAFETGSRGQQLVVFQGDHFRIQDGARGQPGEIIQVEVVAEVLILASDGACAQDGLVGSVLGAALYLGLLELLVDARHLLGAHEVGGLSPVGQFLAVLDENARLLWRLAHRLVGGSLEGVAQPDIL